MEDLRRLFEYNRWASLRFLDAADELTAEELERDISSSFPSVLATLTHMLGAEWVWLSRWEGDSPTGFPDAWDLSTVAAVRERWDGVWQQQRAFLAGLSEGDEDRRVSYRLLSGADDERSLGDLMRHAVNHATYHRGQLTTLLRQLGKAPPSTDYIRYLREQGS